MDPVKVVVLKSSRSGGILLDENEIVGKGMVLLDGEQIHALRELVAAHLSRQEGKRTIQSTSGNSLAISITLNA